MNKPLSEMNNKELFCALTGDHGVVEQTYMQRIAEKYKEKYGHYAALEAMVDAAVNGELGDLSGDGNA